MGTTFGTWANHLTLSPSSGDVHIFADAPYNRAYYDGTKWRYVLHGKELKPPPSFSWVNQTSGGQSGSVSTANGGEHLSTPALGGDHYRLRVTSAPSPPYTLRAAFLCGLVGVDFQLAGLVQRVNSSGKFVASIIVHAGSLGGDVLPHIAKANSATSIAGNYAKNYSIGPLVSNQLVWWEIGDDGSVRFVRVSADGINFPTIHTVSSADFLGATADELGHCVNSNSGFTAGSTLVHWDVF